MFFGSIFCLVLLVVEGFVFYEKISEARESRDALRRKEAETQQQKRDLAELVEYQNKYIDRLLKDVEFRKIEIRQRLGVVEEGEIVIREEDLAPRGNAENSSKN